MSKHILYGPDGRAFTKSQIEGEARLLKARYAGGLSASLFAGAHPMGASEELGKQDLLRTFIQPRDAERTYADEYADGSFGANAIVNTPGVYNERFAKRNPISDLNKPRDIAGIFTQCMRYYEDNYIVNRAITIKKNFAAKDMSVNAKSSTVKAFYESEFRRLRLRQWVAQIMKYYFMLGRVVVFWGYERPIEGLCLLDPRHIVVRTFLTKRRVFLKPDPRWVNILRDQYNVARPEYKFLQDNLPKQWIKYIVDNKEIPLDEGTYALIENDLSLFVQRGISDYTVEGVPLSAAFDALQTHKMLVSGDFSVAWMIKNLIALISIGDPSTEGDGYVPPDQIALQKLEACFQRPEYAMVAYVDPTVNIRYIYPDPAIMGSEKYQATSEMIEYCLGVPGVFTNPDGGNFASATLSLKPFREEIGVARQDVIEQLFWVLLPILKDGVTAKKAGGKEIPDIEFDNDCLVDDKVVQDQLQGQYDRGAISNRSLLEGKAKDFDTELQRKTDEQKHKEVLQPLYDAAHGAQDDGGDGRPNRSGKTTAEGQGTHQPRPSRPTS